MACDDSDDLDKCNIEINCRYAQFSEWCPSGYRRPSFMYKLASLVDSPATTYNNSVGACEKASSNGVVCDSYEECKSDAKVDSTDSFGAICCIGEGSCQYVSNISSRIESNVAIYDNNVAIRCDGSFSCMQSNFIKAYRAGNMYLSAHYAGYGSTIEGNGLDDIYCTGTYSCDGATIENANNLFCNGYQSCATPASIDNIKDTVYVYGEEAAYQSTIGNVGGSVVCLKLNDLYCLYSVCGPLYVMCV